MSRFGRSWQCILACLAFFEGAHACFGDDGAVVHSSTEVPPDAHYELVQSPILARLMLRIDRFTGDVEQLTVDTITSEYFWSHVRMDKLALKSFQLYTDNRVHFQVFLSGILAKNTFLMDIDTGNTWVLTKDEKEQLWWKPID